MTDKVQELVEANKIEKGELTGLEIVYRNDEGSKKRQVYDNYESFCEPCEECGRPRYECVLEKNEETPGPKERPDTDDTGERRTKTDVSNEVNL